MTLIINKFSTIPEKFETGRTRQWLVNKGLGSTNTAVLENYFEKEGFVPPHYHEIEEILICLEGNGKVIVDVEAYEFNAGNTVVISPKSIHEVHNVGEGIMRIFGIFPDAEPKGIWINDKGI